MSFEIFASGNGNFHHGTIRCMDGDDFNTIKLVSEAGGIKGWDDARDAAIGKTLPSADMTDVALNVGTIELLHLLCEGVDFLNMRSDSESYIVVSAREVHLLWPDKVKVARYSFNPGEEAGAEFVKKIAPALKAVDMNNIGVLFALTFIVGLYSSKLKENVSPKLYIQLSR